MAAEGFCLDGKAFQLLRRQKLRPDAAGLQCQDSRTISPHQPCNIRADDMLAQKQLHGAQHRIVVEGSPLHHDMVTQGAHILQLHNLEQGVLDNRQGNTGRDIANLRPILLSLLYLGIHEHRATGAQVYRCLGLQCLGSKFPGSQLQALGKILNKGAAACGACLVQDNAADAALVHIEALHILAADIQHK